MGDHENKPTHRFIAMGYFFRGGITYEKRDDFY